jgi:hypothetical protein
MHEQRKFDILNQQKQDINYYSQIRSEHKVKESKFLVTGKVGWQDEKPFSRTSGWSSEKEVTGKIGSIEKRDYSIKKPQLKIGLIHGLNYVDTYSIY